MTKFVADRANSNARTFRLRNWIIGGYAIPIGLSIISSFFILGTFSRLQDTQENLVRTSSLISYIGDLGVDVQSMSRSTRGYMLQRNESSRQNFEIAQQDAQEAIAELEDLIEDAEQQEILQNIVAQMGQLERSNLALMALVDQGRVEDAIAQWQRGEGREEIVELTQLFDQFKTREDDLLDSALEQDGAASDFALRTVWFAMILSVLISSVAAYWILRTITNRLNATANTLVASTSQIAATVEEQERTTSQQAASVNETTTTMDELGASSRQSAQQAEAAAAAAQQALKLADTGTQSVSEALQGMNLLKDKVGAIAAQILRLSDQTGQIGSISQLVSDLANQTNMLALNAAVEAVRAGEHGKGFSVVAAEIRKLADQSKQSAQKINDLVTDIQHAINSTVMVTDEGTKTVENSVAITQGTADTFSGVAESVNNVVLNNQQILLNIKQQATAVQQVVEAMNAINQGARETANGISQTKAGTQQLREAAVYLTELV